MMFIYYIVSITFYMPWMFVYVMLMLAGMFRLSCLYVFYNGLGSYTIYNLLLYLFCLILVNMNMLIILFIFM
jgi:hypothetical protein